MNLNPGQNAGPGVGWTGSLIAISMNHKEPKIAELFLIVLCPYKSIGYHRIYDIIVPMAY
jgi:hypothetical protein